MMHRYVESVVSAESEYDTGCGEFQDPLCTRSEVAVGDIQYESITPEEDGDHIVDAFQEREHIIGCFPQLFHVLGTAENDHPAMKYGNPEWRSFVLKHRA